MTFWKRENVVLCFIIFYHRFLLPNVLPNLSLFYPINVFNRGPNLYLLTSLIQRDAVSGCYFPHKQLLYFLITSVGHIGLSPRSFFGSRIARYTSSSSTATFQKLLLSSDIKLNPGPPCNQEDQLFHLLSALSDNRNCSSTVGHSNVCGLYCNLNQNRFFLKYSKLDVFAITETHLNESIDNSQLFIDGYCLWRLDRRDKEVVKVKSDHRSKFSNLSN